MKQLKVLALPVVWYVAHTRSVNGSVLEQVKEENRMQMS